MAPRATAARLRTRGFSSASISCDGRIAWRIGTKVVQDSKDRMEVGEAVGGRDGLDENRKNRLALTFDPPESLCRHQAHFRVLVLKRFVQRGHCTRGFLAKGQEGLPHGQANTRILVPQGVA